MADIIPTKYASRAEPNERLRTVFGVDNAITTTDYKAVTKFREKSVKIMRSTIKVDRQNKDGKKLPDGHGD